MGPFRRCHAEADALSRSLPADRYLPRPGTVICLREIQRADKLGRNLIGIDIGSQRIGFEPRELLNENAGNISEEMMVFGPLVAGVQVREAFPQGSGPMRHPIPVAGTKIGRDHLISQVRFPRVDERAENVPEADHPAGVHILIPMHDLHQPPPGLRQLFFVEQAHFDGQRLGGLAVAGHDPGFRIDQVLPEA